MADFGEMNLESFSLDPDDALGATEPDRRIHVPVNGVAATTEELPQTVCFRTNLLDLAPTEQALVLSPTRPREPVPVHGLGSRLHASHGLHE